MSTVDASFRKDLAKVFLYPLLSFFLIPLLGFLFLLHAIPERDALYVGIIERNIDKDAGMSGPEKADAKAFFRAHPPSSVCHEDDPKTASYRAAVCAPYSEMWQFDLARKVSLWTLIGGAIVLIAVGVLGAVAFLSRGAQYLSFVIGWRLLTLVAAVEVAVQGALAVFLSFWVTAFFFDRYFVKLIAVAGIGAALAIFYTIACIFKRPPRDTGVEGELISAADAPVLWEHVRDFAQRVGTQPPDHIIAGIDTNFFVTEAPLTVSGRALAGRSLFISLPLLRRLHSSEADAVLAHELAHLRGGDTESSAKLGPKLVQYDIYCQMMAANTVTVLVFYLMRLYRVILEFALQRESRAREFLADRTAAATVSAEAIVKSLIKIVAYARYRAEIEQKLFAQDRRHEGALGIAGFVASGLAPYAASAQFLDAMKSASVPHPFDSHPPLPERMKNVGCEVAESEFGGIAAAVPAAHWVTGIRTADDVEQRLWATYEQRFAAVHEQSLAYRYEPTNEAERAIVLKYFPDTSFALKGGKTFRVTYAGAVLPESGETLSWDNVANLKYEDGSFSFNADVLTIEHPEKGWVGAKTTKVKLPGLGKEKERFKAILGHYWQRHRVMRNGRKK